MPSIIAVAWVLADRLARWVAAPERPWLFRDRTRLALFLAAMIVLPGALLGTRDLVRGKPDHGLAADEPLWQAAFDAGRELPAESVVMAQEALRFRHASGLKTVDTPWDGPAAIEEVVTHYGVTHLVTAPSGDFAELSNRFIEPYLREYGDRWIRTPHDGYTLWTRAEHRAR